MPRRGEGDRRPKPKPRMPLPPVRGINAPVPRLRSPVRPSPDVAERIETTRRANIRRGAAPSGGPGTTERENAVRGRPSVALMQQRLRAAGFDVRVDGRMGSQTQTALRKYEDSLNRSNDANARARRLELARALVAPDRDREVEIFGAGKAFGFDADRNRIRNEILQDLRTRQDMKEGLARGANNPYTAPMDELLGNQTYQAPDDRSDDLGSLLGRAGAAITPGMPNFDVFEELLTGAAGGDKTPLDTLERKMYASQPPKQAGFGIDPQDIKPFAHALDTVVQDIYSMTMGAPGGIITAISDPKAAAKAIWKDYSYRYGPLLSGDLNTFMQRQAEHPVFFMLDLASALQMGTSGLARAGVIKGAAKVRKIKYADGSVQPWRSPNIATAKAQHWMDRFAEAHPDMPVVGSKAKVAGRMPYELERDYDIVRSRAIPLEQAAKRLSGKERVAYDVMARYGDKAVDFLEMEINGRAAIISSGNARYRKNVALQRLQIHQLKQARDSLLHPSPRLRSAVAAGRELAGETEQMLYDLNLLTPETAKARRNLTAQIWAELPPIGEVESRLRFYSLARQRLSDKDANAVLAATDAMARAMGARHGMSPEDFYQMAFSAEKPRLGFDPDKPDNLPDDLNVLYQDKPPLPVPELKPLDPQAIEAAVRASGHKLPKEFQAPGSIAAVVPRLEELMHQGLAFRDWYQRYAGIVTKVAEKKGVSAKQFAQIVSVYSQRANPTENLRRALMFVNDNDFMSLGGAPQNAKARSILADPDWFEREYLPGQKNPKTSNYYLNALEDIDPEYYAQIIGDRNPVTVDTHMINAMYNDLNRASGIPNSQYEGFAEVFRQIGIQAGLKPKEAQAAIWVPWKAMNERNAVINKGKTPKEVGAYLANAGDAYERGYDRYNGTLFQREGFEGVPDEELIKLATAGDRGALQEINARLNPEAFNDRTLSNDVVPLRDKPAKGDPSPELRDVAAEYMKARGLRYTPPAEYLKVVPERAERIAKWYDEAQHAPDDPAVLASYEAMIRETMEQYEALLAAGYKFEFMPEGKDPYDGSPWASSRDVSENKHMYVFPTREGFGSRLEPWEAKWPVVKLEGSDKPFMGQPGDTHYELAAGEPHTQLDVIVDPDTGKIVHLPEGMDREQVQQRIDAYVAGKSSGDTEHPLLGDSGVRWNGQVVTFNDIFRGVHDAFGHAKEGVGFRADGEENAWRQHVAMYSDEAKPAMTSETRGQNSWVNYGPHGEKNRTATSDTVYADQKAVIAPEWVVKDGARDPGLDELHQTFGEGAGDALNDANELARFIAKVQPEEEWPAWVRNNLRKQALGDERPGENFWATYDDSPGDTTIPKEWDKSSGVPGLKALVDIVNPEGRDAIAGFVDDVLEAGARNPLEGISMLKSALGGGQWDASPQALKIIDQAIKSLEGSMETPDDIFPPEWLAQRERKFHATEEEGSVKAAVEFSRGPGAIWAGEKSDVSSFLHEPAHILRRFMPDEDLWDVEEVLGVKNGNWTRQHEENFARLVEGYFFRGEAPTPRLRQPFLHLRSRMREIYRAAPKGGLTGERREAAFELIDRYFNEAADIEAGDGAFFMPDVASWKGKGVGPARAASLTGRSRKQVYRSKGILQTEGRIQRGPKVTVSDFYRRARLANHRMALEKADEFSSPLDFDEHPDTGGVAPGYRLYNPDGVNVMRVYKETPTKDDMVGMFPAETQAELKLQYDELMAAHFPLSVKNVPEGMREGLRQLPEQIAEAFEQRTVFASNGSSPWARKLLPLIDTTNSVMKAALIYGKLSYIPLNFAGNMIFLTIAAGPFAGPALVRASRALGHLDPEILAGIDFRVGEGSLAALSMEDGTNKLTRSVRKLAHAQSAMADRLPRRAAFIYFAAKEGFRSEKQLRKLLEESDEVWQDGVTYKEISNQITESAEKAMVQFRGMGPFQKEVLSRLIFIYGWMRGAAKYSARMPLDRPLRADLLAHLGQQEADRVEKAFGKLVSYMDGLHATGPVEKVLGIDTRRARQLRSLNPVSTGGEALMGLYNFVSGNQEAGGPQFSDYVAPAPKMAVETLFGYNTFFGESYDNRWEAITGPVSRIPMIRMGKELINPTVTAEDAHLQDESRQPNYIVEDEGRARREILEEFFLGSAKERRVNLGASRARGEEEDQGEVDPVAKARREFAHDVHTLGMEGIVPDRVYTLLDDRARLDAELEDGMPYSQRLQVLGKNIGMPQPELPEITAQARYRALRGIYFAPLNAYENMMDKRIDAQLGSP